MDISKALGVAKALKNHFRAFEFLDEFVNEASALQNVVKEFETRKGKLQVEIKALELEKAEVGTVTAKHKEQAKKRIIVLTEKMEADYLNRKADIAADLSNDISEGEARKNKLKEDLEQMERTHPEIMDRLRQETADAETTLASVEKKIRDIKAKLE